MSADPWDPAQYERFRVERRQPFDDLVALCRPVPGGRVIDLGCGTGQLTADLHRALGAATTLGLDSSAAMLARVPEVPGVRFAQGDIDEWSRARSGEDPMDVVVANASLHWLPDHVGLLARLRARLVPGGQLAFQVPVNFDHPSHVVARRVAAEPRFARVLGGDPPADRGESVLAPSAYAERLYRLGATGQQVRLEIYGHRLDSTAEVVEWVMGSLLRPYRSRLDDADFTAFVDRYRTLLLEELGDERPYFYAFPRILAWARF